MIKLMRMIVLFQLIVWIMVLCSCGISDRTVRNPNYQISLNDLNSDIAEIDKKEDGITNPKEVNGTAEEKDQRSDIITIDLTPYVYISGDSFYFKSEEFYYDYTDVIEFKDDKSKNAYLAYYVETDILPITAFYNTILNKGHCFSSNHVEGKYFNGDLIKGNFEFNNKQLSLYFNIELVNSFEIIAENIDVDYEAMFRSRFCYEVYSTDMENIMFVYDLKNETEAKEIAQAQKKNDFGEMSVCVFYETDDCIFATAGYGGGANIFGLSKKYPHDLFVYFKNRQIVYSYGNSMEVDPTSPPKEAKYIANDYPDPSTAWEHVRY